ncbi:MAG: NAD(P)H-binding protein [Caulobacteraceae bacterium]|nr:NAD(P)H-binding protein [Caulobacteraceae bacterium]
MRILVVGGYGLIGSAIVARLHAEGHDVVGAGRAIAAARRRAPAVRWIEADLGKATIENWGRHLDGIEAVVNCAGALQDGGRDNLRAVHVDGVARLLKACEHRGVTRFVHISAAGLAPGRGAGFNDTKLMSEALIEASSLDWLILRPALVIGPAAYGGTALLRGLAAFPFVIPSIYPASLVQVVAIEDVAQAVSRSLGTEVPVRVRYDLAHREVHRLDHILKRLRSWLGLPEAPVLALPAWLGRITAATGDLLGLLGWRSSLRTTALEQLRQGVRGDPSAAETILDLRFRSLGEMLMRWPSGVQERWFGKSYFLKPLMVTVLAVFWTLSGVIGLTAGRGRRPRS